jgi:hypothetical protein
MHDDPTRTFCVLIIPKLKLTVANCIDLVATQRFLHQSGILDLFRTEEGKKYHQGSQAGCRISTMEMTLYMCGHRSFDNHLGPMEDNEECRCKDECRDLCILTSPLTKMVLFRSSDSRMLRKVADSSNLSNTTTKYLPVAFNDVWAVYFERTPHVATTCVSSIILQKCRGG